MALIRRGRQKYFYRSVRVGGSVRSVYLGHGEVAEALALLDELDRERLRDAREAAEERWRRELNRWEKFEGQILDYNRLVDSLMSWTLVQLGYYLHKRTWRPRRMTPEQRKQLEREINDFWARAAAGDPSTLDLLKRHFDMGPEFYISLFRGDLSARVVDAILDRLAGKDFRQREAIRRKAEEHRKDLAGPSPSAIESILAERCAVLYLAVHESDLYTYKGLDVLSVKWADFLERRRDRANRRFLSGLKALALVKEKLALVEERNQRASRGKVRRFGWGSKLDSRMASVN
jgi:hypothetical protein